LALASAVLAKREKPAGAGRQRERKAAHPPAPTHYLSRRRLLVEAVSELADGFPDPDARDPRQLPPLTALALAARALGLQPLPAPPGLAMPSPAPAARALVAGGDSDSDPDPDLDAAAADGCAAGWRAGGGRLGACLKHAHAGRSPREPYPLKPHDPRHLSSPLDPASAAKRALALCVTPPPPPHQPLRADLCALSTPRKSPADANPDPGAGLGGGWVGARLRFCFARVCVRELSRLARDPGPGPGEPGLVA
jgi:hypothetical protein